MMYPCAMEATRESELTLQLSQGIPAGVVLYSGSQIRSSPEPGGVFILLILCHCEGVILPIALCYNCVYNFNVKSDIAHKDPTVQLISGPTLNT